MWQRWIWYRGPAISVSRWHCGSVRLMSSLPLSVGSNTVYSYAQRLPPSLKRLRVTEACPPLCHHSQLKGPSYSYFFKSIFDVDHFCCYILFLFSVCFLDARHGILAPSQGSNPLSPCTGRQNLSHWATRKSCSSVLIHLMNLWDTTGSREFPGLGFLLEPSFGWGHQSWMISSSVSPGRAGENEDTQRILPRSQQGRSQGLTGPWCTLGVADWSPCGWWMSIPSHHSSTLPPSFFPPLPPLLPQFPFIFQVINLFMCLAAPQLTNVLQSTTP